MEAICPRCMFSFFPFASKPKLCIPSDGVYAHECKTGYIRPYPQFLCSECKPFNEDTKLMSLDVIAKTNHERKLTRFRMQDEEEAVLSSQELEMY